jgi:prepilin peptidase CpaA
VEFYFTGVAAAVACGAAVCDVRTRRIPNRLTYTAVLAGLALRLGLAGWHGLLDGLLGLLTGGGIFFLLFLVRGMGGGDVKLMGAIGSWAGFQQIVVILIATALTGGLMAVAFMLYHHRAGSTLRNLGSLLHFHAIFGLRPHPDINLSDPKAVRLPYGVPIALGTTYALAMILWRG